jgi:hypothetical protein
MPPKKIEALLYELCVDLGFCLPPDAQVRLTSNPPRDAQQFAEAVIRAEGLDPEADISLHLRRDVQNRVAKHFRAAEDEFFKRHDDVA